MEQISSSSSEIFSKPQNAAKLECRTPHHASASDSSSKPCSPAPPAAKRSLFGVFPDDVAFFAARRALAAIVASPQTRAHGPTATLAASTSTSAHSTKAPPSAPVTPASPPAQLTHRRVPQPPTPAPAPTVARLSTAALPFAPSPPTARAHANPAGPSDDEPEPAQPTMSAPDDDDEISQPWHPGSPTPLLHCCDAALPLSRRCSPSLGHRPTASPHRQRHLRHRCHRRPQAPGRQRQGHSCRQQRLTCRRRRSHGRPSPGTRTRAPWRPIRPHGRHRQQRCRRRLLLHRSCRCLQRCRRRWHRWRPQHRSCLQPKR